MKKMIFLWWLCFSYGVSHAQQPDIITEQWDPHPTLHKLPARYAGESAVVLMDKRRIEYIDHKDGLSVYKTLHKIVRVNDDQGIEAFNKVYLGVTDNGDIVDIKARTILPNGKIIDIDKSNIKDLTEDGNQYKIFALEGLEKGCEVEYSYTALRNASFFGREVLQSGYPVLKAQVQIVSPERLVFETRIYNGNQTDHAADTVLDKKRFVTIEQDSIDGADDEKYCSYTANLLRLEYKLSYNTARGSDQRLFTWNELAKRVYEAYTSYSDKELKRVESLIKKNDWDQLASQPEKIIAVENYLKKNIATREDISGDDAENIEKIIRNKIASYRGIIRLYGALFKLLNVNYEFVLAGDREDFTVDKSFEDWDNTANPLLYFPDLRQYMAPTRADMRYPWIFPYWGNTNGLFCKGTTLGNFTTAIGEVKPVTLEDYTHSSANVEATLRINPATDTPLVDIKQIYTGYAASVYRASFTFTSAEEQHQILKEMVKFGTNSESIVSSKIENQDFESYSANKPFILQASVKASELLEKAGNKLLVRIGDVIGTQAEMYQEKPRKFPMELEFPHVLDRKIDLIIPEGYTVKNPEDLKLSNVCVDNGDTTMGFVSSYTREGDTLHIHVHEQYRRTRYPLSQYAQFQKIINTAADFNKIVLVLEKK